MPLLVAILLGLAALALVVYPLVDTSAARRERAMPVAFSTLDAEAGAKQALRDVDFDLRLGNLDESDYATLRDRYEERALAAMKARYDRERAADSVIDVQLATLRSQGPQSVNHDNESTAKTTSRSHTWVNLPPQSSISVDAGRRAPQRAKQRADHPGLRRRREV